MVKYNKSRVWGQERDFLKMLFRDPIVHWKPQICVSFTLTMVNSLFL